MRLENDKKYSRRIHIHLPPAVIMWHCFRCVPFVSLERTLPYIFTFTVLLLDHRLYTLTILYLLLLYSKLYILNTMVSQVQCFYFSKVERNRIYHITGNIYNICLKRIYPTTIRNLNSSAQKKMVYKTS